MKINICPGCLKNVDLVPIVDMVYTYKAREETNELIEQHWHKDCYGERTVYASDRDRLRYALQETIKFNHLRNDRDAYLLAIAEWGLHGKWGADSEFTDRPQAVDFGLE